MAGIVNSYRFGTVVYCPYEGGLYSEAEIDELIDSEGYIPVYDAAEFNEIRTTGAKTMGGCTKWGGTYTTGNDKKYIQIASIDFTSVTPTPFTNTSDFVYDGNELNMTNLSNSDGVGLFTTNNGEVKNVSLEYSFSGSATPYAMGSICGSNEVGAKIINSNVSATILSTGIVDGGSGLVCGLNRGNIINTHATGSISSLSAIIGLFVGRNATGAGSAIIELCSAIGSVTQDRAGGSCSLGGFIGDNDAQSIIKESFFSGDVSNINSDATRRQMGGFVGVNRSSSQIVNCYAWGTINGGSFVGGFCGNAVTGAIIQNSYCVMAVTASGATLGGFQATGGGVTDCYYDSDVSLVSGGNGDPKTTTELQSPTSNTGIYVNWSAVAWDFGTSSDYPVLTGLADSLPDGSITNGILVAELGQSNMEGRFGDSPLNESVVGTAYFWDGSAPVHLLNTRGGATGGSHATYFANKLYVITGLKPIMIESAGSGTGLGTDSGAGSSNNYSSTGTRRAAAETQISACISAIPNITGPSVGLWCQGERDAQQMDSEPTYTRADVKAAMQDVIDWWQTTYPGVPFLISQTGRPSGGDTLGFQDMREVQQEIVDENTNVYMAFTGAVNFPSEGKMGDSLHYDFEGLKDMGEAFADTLSGLLTNT